MANQSDILASNLGYNLVFLRKKRGLTQDLLSKMSDVPRSTITHIESGNGNPSLITLSKIAAVLGVSIEEILSHPRPKVKKTPINEIVKQIRDEGRVAIFRLLPDKIPGIEMDRMVFSPQGRLRGIPHLNNTTEFLVCLNGQIELALEGEKHILFAGDVISFPADQKHSYFNLGKDTSICISVVLLVPF